MLVPAAEQAALAPVADTIRSQLLDLPVTLELAIAAAALTDREALTAEARRKASDAGAVVVLWCEPGPPAQVVLWMAGRNGDQPVVRPVDGPVTGASREAVALIVRSVVRNALQSQEQAQPAPAPADQHSPVERPGYEIPPVPEAPGQPEPAEAWRWLHLELGYAFQPFSSDHPDTHAIQLGLTLNLSEHWCVLLGYRVFLLSVSGTSKSASTRLRRFPVSLGTRLRARRGDLELAGSLLLTLDYVDTETFAPDLDVSIDQSDFYFTVQPELRLSYRMAPRLWIFLGISAEVFVNNKTYGVLGKHGREVLLDPWPVRPQVALGFAGEVF